MQLAMQCLQDQLLKAGTDPTVQVQVLVKIISITMLNPFEGHAKMRYMLRPK